MNLGEIHAECGRLLNDTNNERWITDVLTIRANRSQTKVLGYTNAIKSTELIDVVASSAAYVLSDNVLDVLTVVLYDANGVAVRLTPIDRFELDFKEPNWRNYEAGTPRYYFWDATGNFVTLVPAPNYSYTDGLRPRTVNVPADMSATTDVPFDANAYMVPYHMAIAHDVVADCWMDDGTPEALAKSKFHRSGLFERPGEFEKQIMRIREDFDAPTDVPSRILWRPQGGRVGRGGRVSKDYPFSF